MKTTLTSPLWHAVFGASIFGFCLSLFGVFIGKPVLGPNTAAVNYTCLIAFALHWLIAVVLVRDHKRNTKDGATEKLESNG